VAIAYSNTYSGQKLSIYSPHKVESSEGNLAFTPFGFKGGYNLPTGLVYLYTEYMIHLLGNF